VPTMHDHVSHMDLGKRHMVTGSENRIERPDSKAGFTVVEVVVALTILAVSLGVLLNAMSNSIRQTGQAEAVAEAGSLAQSLLAKIGTELPLRDGQITGQSDRGFRWRVYIEAYGDGTDRREWPVGAHQILAEVLWSDGLQERSVVLTTLRLGPKEPMR
jgi:general secretion pathway protein I